MPNLMTTPSAWQDGYTNSPPAVWNGTLYDFTGFDASINTMRATAAAGDTVDFDLNNLAASNAPAGLQVFINEVLNWQHSLAATGTTSYHSGPLNAADVVRITADVEDIAFYVVDFTLSAISPPVPPVAPDIEVSIPMNSPTITITPTITGG